MNTNIRIAIIALKDQGSGDEVELTAAIESGENREHRVLVVASRMLFELGNIGVGVLPYSLTCEQFDLLEYDARLWVAVKKGLDLLSYSDSSRRRLADKLRERGFDRDIASDAVDYIVSLGLIDEARQLSREVEKLVAKGYGRSRIRQELIRKGFSGESSASIGDLLDEVDFESVLASQLEKKLDLSRLSDRAYIDRLTAAMYRLGHAPGEVRRAIRSLAERED